MILVVLPEGGCWWTLSSLQKYGGDKSQAEQGDETGEETVQDRKTTELCVVRECETQRLSLIAGDTNDPKCLGFDSVKPRKVGGRSTSPEGRAVLHQAADESFVCGQELMCANEGMHDEGFSVGDWLWRPTSKYGLPKKNHGC